MTITDRTPAARATRRDPYRFVGLASAIVFLTGYVLWSMPPYIYDNNPDDWARDLGEGSTPTRLLVLSHLVLPLAGILLIWTVARIRRGLETATTRPSAALPVASGAAVVFAAGFMVMGAASHVAGLVATGDYIDGFPADPMVGYGIDLLGGNVGNATVWGAAVLMVAVGIAAWRESLLPRWLIWLGFVTAPLLVAAWYYGVPVLLFCLWVAVAGYKGQTERVPA